VVCLGDAVAEGAVAVCVYADVWVVCSCVNMNVLVCVLVCHSGNSNDAQHPLSQHLLSSGQQTLPHPKILHVLHLEYILSPLGHLNILCTLLL
jgi:hypothetical protein